MRPDLTISIISTDNLELLLPCLRSVFENTRKATLEVYLIDNASTDGTAAAVQAQFPQVTVIRNETRKGFSTNNNMVLHRGRGRYLMLLNDDTLVLDDALDRMVDFMDTHSRVGVAGGSLIMPDGCREPSFSRFPHPIVEGLWPSVNWTHRLIRDMEHPLEVDSVCGAALLVRREMIAQVGVLDTAFDPIYSEEVDWCYRAKRAGWKIYTLPGARILHYGGYTMNQIIPRKYELLLSKKALFFRKHRGARAANVYKATLVLLTALKFIGWTLVGLLRRNHRATREKRLLHWHLLGRIPAL